MNPKDDGTATMLREIIESTPIGFGVHDAERARLCAEQALETGSQDLLLVVLAEGFKKILSAEHSRMRAKARRHATVVVKRKTMARQLMIAQLQYPTWRPAMSQ
jgi:hypothetical protein